MAGITGTDLSQLPVKLPPLAEQRTIAHILGTLDDKIELNRRMNQTLEEMARAIFKDWFIDFGPTRAKMEGREPYLPAEVWDLFPDSLVGSKLGAIPEGWSVGRLSDIADSPRRSVKPVDIPDDTPYIGLQHMPRRSIALTEWEYAGQVTSGKSVFKKGEFLFGKLRPYFHKVGIAPLGGVCSTDVVVIHPKDTDWSAIVLLCVSGDAFVEYTDRTSTGTRMPRTNWKLMGDYEVCLPPREVAGDFQIATKPLFDRIASNVHENRSLSIQRDALLPKLVTGELPVGVSELNYSD